MTLIIGFAGNGHLMEHSAAAAHIKGFERITYTPGKTGDSLEDLHKCDIVYICPDRPSKTSPENMVRMVLPRIRRDTILVILCQVRPGFTRDILHPHVYYQVETLRMKDAMHRALYPDRIIIGCFDPDNASERLLNVLSKYNCPIIAMSYESAELAKMAINIYLAAQVSVTNTLSEIAEKIGADWNEIIPALQTDKRIGKEAYLEPGYGLSQHLIRDLKNIHEIGGYNGIDTQVTDAFLEHSEYRKILKHT